ncbi:protein of unknown function (plasmid) [Cupriavidus taiwanensis]|uniref:Uncharacterized protein n=1 Tax=Cupriavidus taiwanensis TaxID=164546 RepID=A0A7Z7NPA0_9BURK|nr:protein of unknown function [Cupriavidus taiwanensis]SOZ11657.1 protein of unknown function [Cupriavidus taiwanensis]SOZ43011.1 protein of unknown function [Cupriavidus taiwanensis]SPC22258.1 protein of unknown function [Cupriavidus taiwanensis]SPD53760.1 protein of unknown function [Cupriavidus taiwanensis]
MRFKQQWEEFSDSSHSNGDSDIFLSI